jgi:hypothetical protein
MRALLVLSLAAIVLAAGAGRAEPPPVVFPLIQQYGGVALLPEAPYPPRKGAKIVFDITTDSPPEAVNRGLESVARYLNLNAQAGHAPSDARLTVVLHGGATRCALSDAEYHAHTRIEKNPNLQLLRELKKHGVELLVCGQSLARNQFAHAEVAEPLSIAVSAMTVNVEKQREGYAYLAIH